MRLATLILPNLNNDGVSEHETHYAMQAEFCAKFGGFTLTPGQGGWVSATGQVYHDVVSVYGIAMADSAENRATLESLAVFYGHMAGQLAVMVTHANGEVAFLDVVAAVLARSQPA